MVRTRLVLLVAALVLALAALLAAAPAAGADRVDDDVELHLFWLRTCPHCAAARAFLDELEDEFPRLVVHDHEVSSDREAQRLFVEMAAAHGQAASAVPTIILGDRMWVGFDEAIGEAVRAEVAAVAGAGSSDASGGDDGGAGRDPDAAVVDVPLLGRVDVGSSSLLVSTVVVAVVDGVNPCSLWVLSILLALVLHSGSRRRVALVGSTFLVVTTALYGLYVVGAYSLLSYASYLPWIQRAVAAVVAAFAVVNLRDYLRPGRPATLAIPAGAKPGIYRRARGLVAPERSVLAVLGGTTALAVGVSLVETPCSAALPLLWTNLVAAHDASTAAAVALFALYMAIFLVDELVLFGAVVVTMRATRLQEHHGRILRLVTGSVMLALSATMLLDPTLLEGIAGTLAVLAAATAVGGALAAVAHLSAHHERRLA